MIATLITILVLLLVCWVIYWAAGLLGVPAVPRQILGVILFLIILIYALKAFGLVTL